MRVINSTNWPDNSKQLPDFNSEKDDIDQAKYFRSFARACYDNRYDVFAFVDGESRQEQARSIYERLSNHYFLKGQTFKIMNFASEEELEKYASDPFRPFNEGQICLALIISKWSDDSHEDNTFTVKIRYTNQIYRDLLSNNLTTAQDTNEFDFDEYYSNMNTSLFEVMSSVTEQIIYDVNGEESKGSYQLKLVPSF